MSSKTPGHPEVSGQGGFLNEPPRDFTDRAVRDEILQTLARVRAALPMTAIAVVNGLPVIGLATVEVKNPSRLSETVTRLGLAGPDQVSDAVGACCAAMAGWGMSAARGRCAILRRVAEGLNARRSDLTARIVLEVGKSIREADAEVCEAIDFCRYYAVEMEQLAVPRRLQRLSGEDNYYSYLARGTTVVIAPWNFPLAILCGMTVAALVAGNPVIMKPAEQASGIAFELFEIFLAAGVPENALHFLSGRGEEIGAMLVAHPQIHVIAFTGSRVVGLNIVEEAAKTPPGQRHVKKVIAEMGGKNAVIIDEDADLDEAVVGTLASVFGFQGQKCSALSRLLVHRKAMPDFLRRFTAALMSLRFGPADDPVAQIGPVIDAEAQARLLGVIARFKDKIVAQLPVPPGLKGLGHYVPPTVFADTDFAAELGQTELFGPLVALYSVDSMDAAVRAFNGVDYALTGGIYSRSPVNIERAKRELEVGNLYINREITGAIVGRQPFGGFKLSGVGAKAGGPDYLLQFLEPRTISENTLRRGFAPID